MSLLLEVNGLAKAFEIPGSFGQRPRRLRAVQDVSFTLEKGETLGIVGESGCGKSTLGKLLLRLLEADAGSVRYRGEDLLAQPAGRLRELRREMQMIFQDPYSSLNPRMCIGDIVGEPLLIHRLAKGTALKQKVLELLDTVGLPAAAYGRYPHEFSGGQRQRIGIARALAVAPRLIIADEPVSALDLSIQAQVINLLQEVRDRFGLTTIVIAHDLAVVQHLSDRIGVMYLGRLVELGPADAIIGTPRHPYTEALLAAVPVPEPGRPHPAPLRGEVPSPLDPPPGCPFHPRCPYALELCRQQLPGLEEKRPGHTAACHFSEEVGRRAG